jgi:hypothetical protein
VERDADLFHVVDTLAPAGGLARGLDGRQPSRDQDRDDRDHYQKLDEREAPMSVLRGQVT